CWVGLVLLAGVVQGPWPWWSHLPGGADERAGSYAVGAHARTAARAVALVPDDAVVSAGNTMGAHLSERERIYMFPVVRDAGWIVVDETRPYMGDRRDPAAHAVRLEALRADPRFAVVFDEDGIVVL